MTLPERVRLLEVGPRDGLQNEALLLPTALKLALVQRLQDAGLRAIELTSFVSPKWVPQMADSAELMAALVRKPGVRYSVLTPNLQGLNAALVYGPDEIVVFASASESFSQKNINCSIAQSLERFAPVVAAAKARGIAVRGALSCALACPFEGATPPQQVRALAGQLRAIGVEHLGVADTLGVGTPRAVQRALEAALQHFDLDQVSGHYHDSYGQALANVLASLELGVWQFDSSVAGLGGCPYAPGATGNVATEDLVFMLEGMGIATGVDLDVLVDAAHFISSALGRKPLSRSANALHARRALGAKA